MLLRFIDMVSFLKLDKTACLHSRTSIRDEGVLGAPTRSCASGRCGMTVSTNHKDLARSAYACCLTNKLICCASGFEGLSLIVASRRNRPFRNHHKAALVRSSMEHLIKGLTASVDKRNKVNRCAIRLEKSFNASSPTATAAS